MKRFALLAAFVLLSAVTITPALADDPLPECPPCDQTAR